jgi:hypothetical protein
MGAGHDELGDYFFNVPRPKIAGISTLHWSDRRDGVVAGKRSILSSGSVCPDAQPTHTAELEHGFWGISHVVIVHSRLRFGC